MKTNFLVVGLNPTIQNTFTLPVFRVSQVNRVARHRVDVAGKGANTTRVLTQLGENAVHLTFGGGRNLDLYRDLCAGEGIELRCVECDVAIRYCHTLLGEADQTTTEIVEPGHAVPNSVEQSIVALYDAELEAAHTVIIGGSRAPGFSDGLYAEMVRKATVAGVRTVLDIRGDDLLGCIAHRPSAIKINVSEFSHTFTPQTMLDEDINPEDIPREVFDAMVRLHAESGSEIVLTNGSRPVLLVVDDSVETMEPESVRPVNTVGSGDAATAGLAAGLHRGMSIEGAVRLAMDCAAKNVQLEKPGSIR
jgi:1-phosphofructokinase